MQLPWLELDIEVPTGNILKEFQNVKNQIVKHRSKDQLLNQTHKGWNSLTIHGIDPSITTEQEGDHTWTSIADQCPNTKQWIEKTFIINDNTRRIRFQSFQIDLVVFDSIRHKHIFLQVISLGNS